LTDTPAMRLDLPDGLTTGQYAALRGLAPAFAAMCARLAEGPVPESLDHNDFHDGNILVRDGRYSFFDWGDACVTHPFFSMVVTLRSIANRFGLEEGAPEMEHLRDIYLEPWTRFETREHLLPFFDLAQRAGMVGRALTWHRVLSDMEGPHQAEFADAVPGWLLDFLNAKINITAMR
jgi:Ser/Thr protein kinase RdoA (MazF antagonist)